MLHSLRGTLPLLGGERVENEQLKLGVFTQDLAQELDGDSRGVDIVTAYARADYDINISDEHARSVMGRLGLQGQKALRKITQLSGKQALREGAAVLCLPIDANNSYFVLPFFSSGGEKARVALSNFAIKPSNCILLDEVSNHLDQEWYDLLVANEGDERQIEN